MTKLLTLIAFSLAGLSCKPSRSLQVSPKKDSSAVSSAPVETDRELDQGNQLSQAPAPAAALPSASAPEPCNGQTPAQIETSCSSGSGSGNLQWKISRMLGNCYDNKVETWCYEASSSEGTFKGTIVSYCTGKGNAQEYEVANPQVRPPRQFSVNWKLPSSDHLTSRWVSNEEVFDLSCVEVKE